MNRLAKTVSISSPAATEALAADRTNAVPSWPRRLVVLLVAAPLMHFGYFLAWPGLKLSIIGHAIVTAMLKTPNFKKN